MRLLLFFLELLYPLPSPSSCTPPNFKSNSSSAPFAESEIDLMRGFFIANLNYQSVGAVIASPDDNVLTGGSYRYHWARDGALSMRSLLLTFVSGVTNHSLVDPYMKQYVQWVLTVHNQTDPFNQDILTEPKFDLNGTVYGGGWCRPQNDGPSLRATTLIMFARMLIQNGEMDFVKVSSSKRQCFDY